jgi:dihydroorotate dehydrogenase (fumarate)
MKLTTSYLGLPLANPFMPGASPLADTLDNVLKLEDAGAAAIVMRSLFEEQILRERWIHRRRRRQRVVGVGPSALRNTR